MTGARSALETGPTGLDQTLAITLRHARVDDVGDMLDLINGLATDGVMLPRSPASIVENLRDFVVATVGDTFVGCGALAIIWTDLAEIRSIAIAPEYRQHGIGRAIADKLLETADELGIARVMAFTYVVGFFERLGFQVVEHSHLPHKVFNDCLNCPKFHKCDEIAVLKELRPIEGEPARGPLSLPMPGHGMPKRR
ncbi:MAG: N-acetyltransferase [Planctomycetota bacterium]